MIGHSVGHRKHSTLLRFLAGLAIGSILLPALVYLYVASGKAPVSASDPEFPFERLVTDRALHAVLGRNRPLTTQLPATEANLAAGARGYVRYCALCHGLPTGPVTKIATGMFPPPPQFFHGNGVSDRPAGETLWKTANGIRLTGMPGFRGSLSDAEMWQISLLLAHANHLPPSVRQQLDSPVLSSPSARRD